MTRRADSRPAIDRGRYLPDGNPHRLRQAVGAETSALWRTDRTGLELAGGHFNATARSGQTRLGRVADAFWRGVVRHYGYW